MVAYNFKAQFADAVARGEKNQTIRPPRKSRHARKGEPIQLYTGMRTKACRKLVSPDPKCLFVYPIQIGDEGVLIEKAWNGGFAIVKPNCLNDFARADGFEDWPAMRDWFTKTHTLPFRGVLIRWGAD